MKTRPRNTKKERSKARLGASTIYVIQHTPTAIQNWLKNCYFGKPDNPSLLRKTWAEEESALRQLQEDAMPPEEKQQLNQRLVETSERA